MPQHWALWLSVDGDLRFLSHHDMMRLMERLTTLAALPLRYSQGFNPRPILSLPCPRPVGVSSRDDVLILGLEETASPLSGERMLSALNRVCPAGLAFLRMCLLEGKKALHPQRIEYELGLLGEQVAPVAQRISQLKDAPAWPIERKGGKKGPRGPSPSSTIDLRPMVADITLEAAMLRWALVPNGQSWARPSEVLSLLTLDGRVDLARSVRAKVQYE